MIIPSQLKIGGHIFTIERREMDGKCGETDYNKYTITIDAALKGIGEGATLIHEIFHVINGEFDHTLLESLAQQLFQVLSDNGMLASPTVEP